MQTNRIVAIDALIMVITLCECMRQWVPNKNEATVCHKRWYYLRNCRWPLPNFEDAQSVHTTGIKNFQVVAFEPPSNPCKSLAGPVNAADHVFFRVFCQLWKLYLCFSNFNSFPITFIDSNSESPLSLLSKRKAFFPVQKLATEVARPLAILSASLCSFYNYVLFDNFQLHKPFW